MWTVSINQAEAARACRVGLTHALSIAVEQGITPDQQVPLPEVWRQLGYRDAIWVAVNVLDKRQDVKHYALWCARQVEHLSSGPCVKACNDATERYLRGELSRAELRAVAAAVYADDADDAADAAYDVYDAAYDAADYSVAAAVYTAADAAANANPLMRERQFEMFTMMCEGKAPWQIK